MMARIAVVGRTGALGSALAKRLMRARHEVTIGSRTVASAEAPTGAIGAGFATIAEAVRGRDLVIVAMPFAAQGATLADIRDHDATRS